MNTLLATAGTNAAIGGGAALIDTTVQGLYNGDNVIETAKKAAGDGFHEAIRSGTMCLGMNPFINGGTPENLETKKQNQPGSPDNNDPGNY